MALRRSRWSHWIASLYALLGERDEAFRFLENAVNRGINYPFLTHHDPFLENLRGETCFKKLMERVKCEWEHFDV